MCNATHVCSLSFFLIAGFLTWFTIHASQYYGFYDESVEHIRVAKIKYDENHCLTHKQVLPSSIQFCKEMEALAQRSAAWLTVEKIAIEVVGDIPGIKGAVETCNQQSVLCVVVLWPAALISLILISGIAWRYGPGNCAQKAREEAEKAEHARLQRERIERDAALVKTVVQVTTGAYPGKPMQLAKPVSLPVESELKLD